MSLLAAYSGPWKGMNTSIPDNHIDRSEAALAQNFTFYEGFMQQPSYSFPFPSGGTPDNEEILTTYSFTDANNNLHQGVITVATLYDGVSTSSWGTGYALPASGTFINTQVFTNALFFVNGSTYVMYFDGITLAIQVATNQFGGKYIFELASSLCLANTTEATGVYPQRVRWAAAGSITQWDPMSFIGAGFADLRECPDGITGVMNTNPVAYIIRSNGITQMIPTGIGTSAFDFNHLWASQRGIGDVVGTTVANYGPVGFVVAADDVYILTASSYDKIGSKIKNLLYQQLISTVYGSVGWIEPLISAGQPYLRYRIAINLSAPITRAHTALVIWSFSTEDYKWEYEYIDYPTYELVFTGVPGNIGLVQTSGVIYNYPAIPVLKGTTVPTLLIEGTPANGAIFYPSRYLFKKEYDPEYKTITVRQVLVRYQYLGNAAGNGVPVTIQVNGMFGNSNSVTLNLADPAQTKIYYGGLLPPTVSGNYYSAIFSVPLTDYEYQVTLSIASPLNEVTTSVRITDVMVFGTVGGEVSR